MSVIVAQTTLVQEGVSSRVDVPVQLIPTGVDTARFSPASPDEKTQLRQRLGIPTDHFVVVNVGRLIHEKNQITLLQAVAEIKRREPGAPITAIIIGSTEANAVNSNESALERFIGQHGLADVVTLKTDVKDVRSFLKASDTFAHPTYFDEGLSNALLEAMACGLDVVSSDLPQNASAFPEGGGRFFSPKDSMAMTQQLLASMNDPAGRQTLGELHASHIRQHYSASLAAERYADLLRRLAAM